MAIIAIIIIVGVVFGFIGYSTENTWMTGIGIVIAILFACCILGYCCGVTIPEWQCKQKAEAMGVECKFDFFAGCLVKYHGVWYPIDSRRVFE